MEVLVERSSLHSWNMYIWKIAAFGIAKLVSSFHASGSVAA